MKNSELINLLQKYDGNLEVTISDRKGTFSGIKSVEMQEWGDEAHKHASVTLVLDGYDENKTFVKDEDKEFGKFIDNVNKELSSDDEIDKNDALKAKDAFDFTFDEMQKKYKEWYDKKYNDFAHDSMIDLFGSDVPLNEKNITELKLHVYENGWQCELEDDELNDKNCLLRFLYGRLENDIKERISLNANKLWNDITGTILHDGEDEKEDDLFKLLTMNFNDFTETFKKDPNLRSLFF